MFNNCVFAVLIMIAIQCSQCAIIRLPQPTTTERTESDQPTNETVNDSSILNILSNGFSNLFALTEHGKNSTSTNSTNTDGFIEIKVVDTITIDQQRDEIDENSKHKQIPKSASLNQDFQNAVVKTDYIGNFNNEMIPVSLLL